MNPGRYRKRLPYDWRLHMAGRAATQFEHNTHSYGMTEAIRHAKAIGNTKAEITPQLVCDLHQMTMREALGQCAGIYRQNAVLFATFKPNEIPHPDRIPRLMLTLCADVAWMLDSPQVDTYAAIARTLYRLVRMQPFQDGNKRTAFAVAAYLMAWRGVPGVLVPDAADCQQFVDAVVAMDETVIVQLVKKWHRRC